MGQRSKTETVVVILQAFLESRSWTQAELARRAEVSVPAVRKHLDELSDHGFPLTHEKEHPHVWWSVPNGWFPGAVLFDSKTVPELLRQLSRLRRSAARDKLIHKILEAAPRPLIASPDPSTVVTPEPSENEEMFLPTVEDSATQRVCLKFRYFTASRSAVEWRHASVHRVSPGPPARFVAVCHKHEELRWFRVDAVLGAHLDRSQTYRAADPARVDAMVKESVDGYHFGDAVHCAFFVRKPTSHWVARNLPSPMIAEVFPDGLRATGKTAGVLRLARFVVGLGADACVETPELALLVAELARGALEASGAFVPPPEHQAERSLTPPD
jgi:predicted DNA-binding transcriptional regulator YafY